MKQFSTALLLAGLGAPALAAPTIDGVLDNDGSYGAPVSVQTVQTQFGDNFSEINAAYAQVENDTLYLVLTGNHENNFNKYFVFFDTVAGGQNAIDRTNNPQNFDSQIGAGFNNAWDAFTNRGLADTVPWTGTDPAPDNFSEQQAGNFTFDSGFEADYAMLFRRGAGKYDFDYAIMDQTAIDADEFTDIFLGFDEGPSFAPLTGTNSGETFEVGYDNSNAAGVAGGTQAADQTAAAAVTTGVELAIPFSALGLAPGFTGEIHVHAHVNGSNADFVSNQFLGGLQPIDGDNDPNTPDEQGNLGSNGNGTFLSADINGDGLFDENDDVDGSPGEDPLGSGLVDLNDFAGNQFFTINIGGVSEILGDYNDNGLVEQGDLNQVLNNWGQPFDQVAATWILQRPTEGIVDQAELNVVLNRWGSDSAPDFSGSAVPEPATLAVMSGLGVLALRRRSA